MKRGFYHLTAKQLRYQRAKHCLDVILALAMLILLALPILFICVLQKISSPHEAIFFRQSRVGLDGKLFTITKFRSMKSSAPKYMATGEIQDAELYISRLGRFLRDTSMDELPQLFQVIHGDMSLIGPRPLIPQEWQIHELRKAMGVYQLRPGLTGWAQVNGRDLVNGEMKAALDREYLEKMGLRLDVKILLMTVGKVLGRVGIRDGSGNEGSEKAKCES